MRGLDLGADEEDASEECDRGGAKDADDNRQHQEDIDGAIDQINGENMLMSQGVHGQDH